MLRTGEPTAALQGIESLVADGRATPLQRLEAELIRVRLTTDPSSGARGQMIARCEQEGLGAWARQILEGAKPGRDEDAPRRSTAYESPAGSLPDDEAVRAMQDLHREVEIEGYRESFQGREIQILHLMARGASNTEIADIVYISVNTVRWYARQIYAKLGVRRRGEAVQAAWRHGLIGPPVG